jgi:adenylate cyclase
MGELALAREHNEQGIALYNPRHHHTYVLRYGEDPGVACRSVAASVLWYLGYPDQALMLSEEALTLADELAHPNSQAYALALDANLHWKRREGRSTQERAEIAIAFAAEHGFAVWLEFARFLRARALVELGQVEEGIEGMRHALSTWRDMGGAGLPYFLALLAEGYGAAGRPEKGLDLLAEGLVEVDKSSDPKWKAEIHRLSGDFLLMDGRDEAEAERNFLMAAEVARQQSAKSFELRATMSLCRLLRRQGKEKEARKLLANIYNWFTEGFETPDLIEAKELMDELS